MEKYQSWGRSCSAEQLARPLLWRFDNLPTVSSGQTMLPYGMGRSYGDSCLNDGGIIIPTRNLGHYIHFDSETGVLRSEAGITLAEILDLIVPHGWFLPVTPGTRFVTLGGAIANDVHGKNHHVAGTFGCHINKFELLRSDGSRLTCSATENSEYFKATIGGLGLTGLITWAEIQLKPIKSDQIDKQSLRFGNLDEFLTLSRDSDKEWEYTVAWVDCLSSGRSLGRGMFFRGRHHDARSDFKKTRQKPKINLRFPFDAPSFLLNKVTLSIFNSLYYHRPNKRSHTDIVDYEPFFYPLDGVHEWNRLYGKRGLFQFQCVIPDENAEAMVELLKRIARSGQGSFLAVIKRFGNKTSPGLMSFPRPGITLALDFANKGMKSTRLLAGLEEIVVAAGGAMYPAKDALMSANSFSAFFPQLETFTQYIDPAFSSSFWRRVSTPDQQL